MLQRAASKAYSWWWASHIRTKQSKWLEQNLQDMQEKVQSVLKLIEEDGDSFAKRAEMYYKKRPELINFVEESYRAYRALAERYDHISTELQNANNTIAYVFPEQVQFDMEEEEDEAMPRFSKKTPEGSKANIPKVPKIPKQLKAVFESTNKKKSESKKSTKKGSSGSNNTAVPKSGLSKAKGLQEIDRLQKQILALQTEKEFLRSSYESGLAKYWETDQQIRDIQEKICSLQDEFGAGTLIEDEEARSLMASAALKSCEETLNQLQEKQERSAEEAAVERKRISHARERLKSLKFEFLNDDINEESLQGKDESVKALEELKSSDQEVSSSSTPAKQELELLREKIKQHFEDSAADSLTVTEMAEKIDELVNKVISLETAVSSQTALIKRLRTETDELQSQIRTLEEDKATLISGKNDLSDKLREMEEKLQGLQDLNQSIEDQNNNLQTHFTEAHCNLDHLSVKLLDVRPDEELPTTMKTEVSQGKPEESPKVQERAFKPHESLQELQKVEPEEEPKVLAKSNEQSKGQEDAKKPDDGPQEKQAGKPYLELKASDSPQKGKKSPVKATEVALPTESKEQEKQNQLEAPVKAKDNKGVEERVKEHNLGTSNEELRENASPSLTRNDTDKSTKKLPEAGEKVELVEQKVEQASRRTLNEKNFEQASPGTLNDVLTGETPDEGIEADDESNWKQLFTDGIESREKSLLKEYTTILRNYKEVKKQLAEAEKKNADSLFDVTVQLRELKGANAKKDEQIRFLRQKLSLLQAGLGEDNASDKPTVPESPMADKEVSEDFSFIVMEQATSEIEERFRTNIDQVLEENLDFWLRFSNTFQQIQKFETEVQDLQSDMTKIEEKKNRQEGSSTSKYNVKSDARALYKHLREIHTELSVWLEKSILLKDELKSRFSSLCGIQEEITAALKESAEDEDFKFTSYQAAKFQGEILNMKQENNRVADELQAGLDHATTLQLEVEKTLAKLNEEFKISGSKKGPNIQLQHSDSRSQVPLRSFIFGVKQKKQKHSIFSCVHPVLQRKYNAARLGSIL